MRRLRVLPIPALFSLAGLLSVAACSGSEPATAPELGVITLSAGAINPAFDPAIHEYSAVIPSGTLNLTVTPSAGAGLAVTISQDGGPAAQVASGTASAPLAVPARGSLSVITVVASRGNVTATYTIHLAQADDNDATLSGLTVTAGTLNPP